MTMKTYTGFINDSEIREVYNDGSYSIIKTYKNDIQSELYLIMTADNKLVGFTVTFDTALLLLSFKPL